MEMKQAILQHACASAVAVLILFFGISDVRAHSRKSIKLNETAFLFAAQLIKQGHAIADRKGIGGALALNSAFFLIGSVLIFTLPETKNTELT